ncbi:hypothetical protein L917_10206 [Phytophthora nicotianae]|uniref:Uncharacterized protein n=1 Tax=Phytophthora nicotianae TaxID=4792 RepID=W2IWZ1_PHYNI|nr:hypothetical protein L915_10428 [Phytophthora nicotianae]ETL38067.1 hypothetical protein L916_10320 [Phytophthora nicotianae]ETL91228.1 hypothetical protein L917_10206 [Phytophthora nicotianae]ETM44546.1 hypothetical protein L914_10234 [Phytophthora nicotianae]
MEAPRNFDSLAARHDIINESSANPATVTVS